MSTDINFLLDKDGESVKRQKRVKFLNFVAIVLLVGSGILTLFFFILTQTINVSSIKKSQEDMAGKISQFKTRQTKLFFVKNRANDVEEILANRKDLFHAMNGLLAKTSAQLSVDNLQVDDKSILITAQSTSLFPIGEFINNLTDMVRKKEIINSLTLNSIIFYEDKNYYQVSIKAEL